MFCKFSSSGSRCRGADLTLCSVEDKSVRYVAEENIVDVSIAAGANLMSLAGRHFKRYDEESKVFVSNLKDEYPDD